MIDVLVRRPWQSDKHRRYKGLTPMAAMGVIEDLRSTGLFDCIETHDRDTNIRTIVEPKPV